MRAALVVTACLALGAGVSLGQEGRVVRDEWRAQFRGAAKVGWAHQRVIEREGARGDEAAFVVEDASWTPVADGLVRTGSRTEADKSGRIRRRTTTHAAPWGTVTTSVEPAAAGGLSYQVQVRDRPVVEGTLEDAWSEVVLDLLVQRGAQPPGKRTVRSLDLPGEGVEERQVETRREGERWRFEGEGGVEWRAADGAFVRAEREDHLGYVWLPATEADAADASVVCAEPREAPETTSVGRLRVARPGADWRLMHKAETDKAMIGVEHPSGVGVAALKLSMRMPPDEGDRLRFAAAMREGMNASRENPTRDGFEMGEPAPATWRDLPAVRFEVGGQLGNEPVTGEAYLVDLGDGSTAMVLLGWPAGLAEARAADLEQAKGAVELVTAADAAWVRRDFRHATLELPEPWGSPTGGALHVKSPMGASQVNVTAGAMPEGLTLDAAQRFWIQRQQQNPGMASLEVERQEETTVGGRSVLLAVTRGRLKENQGVSLEVRCASVLLDRGDGNYAEVIVVAFDLDWDLGAVERVLDSVRWVEEH